MRRRLWRNRYTFGAGILLWAVVGLAMLSSKQSHGLSGMLFPGTFLTGICYDVSVLSMLPLVKLTPEALRLRNPGVEMAIHWDDVQKVDYRGGLRIHIRGEREAFASAAFQGSIFARLAGYPGAPKAAEAIERYQRDRDETQVRGGKTSRSFPWQAHLRFFVVGWVTVTVVLPVVSALMNTGTVEW